MRRGASAFGRCVIGALSFVVLFACGCARKPGKGETSPRADVVASVQGRPITLAAFQDELARSGAKADKEQVLRGMIRREALLLRARELGYGRSPEVVRTCEQLLITRYFDDQLNRLGASNGKVTEAEAIDYYASHEDLFAVPEERRGSVIFVRVRRTADPTKRTEMHTRVETIRARVAEDPAVFANVAAEFSDDQASRHHGGDTGWLAAGSGETGRWEKEVAIALFALNREGEIGPVIEAPGGLYVLRLDRIRPRRVRPFEEVRSQVKYLAVRDRQHAQEERIGMEAEAGLEIVIDRARVASIPVATNQTVTQRPPDPPGL